jgi:predicted Zn-dependent protease
MQQQGVASRRVDASRLGELKDVVASALSEAHSTGASQAEADVSLQRGLTVTVRLGEVDTIEYHRDRGLSVTVYFGKSKGSASTADLRPAAVHATVVKASAIAQHTAADACAGLADPQALAREIPDLDLYHFWDIEPEQAIELARGVFGHFIGAISGTSQYRRSSFLLNAAGEPVFPSFLNIVERPHLRQGLASSPFDAEGVATRDRDLVSAGVLQGYVLGSYSARKLGLTTTGNAGGIHNLLVSSGETGSFEELLRRMDTGFYVTELMGQGVNGVTGDYSRGASGFWVEHGAIAYPVHEVTIAGNLREMLRTIVAVGSDVDVQGAIRTGSVLIEAMTIAGE